MMIFALDTNIISYLLKDDDDVFEHYIQQIRSGNECVIPPMVYYEVKRGLLLKNATAKEKSFEKLCHEFDIGEMNIVVWDEAARLYALHRQQGRAVEDADLIIAAFCLVNGYTLVTNNVKHFSMIDGLQLANWKE